MLKRLHSLNLDLVFDILMIVLAIFAVVPFFQISQYNVIASDDFFHGFFLKDMSYWDSVKHWYQSGYNGRYTNAFIMQLPGRPYLNAAFYKVFPVVSFLLLFGSITLFIRSVTKAYSWSRTLMFSVLLFTVILTHNPHIRQFYWFSGHTVYVLPAIFYFLTLYLLTISLKTKFRIASVAGLLLSIFIIIGSNENWMIIMLFTVFSFAYLDKRKHDKIRPMAYVLVLYTIALSLLVIFSPGTTHRLKTEVLVSQNQDFWASFTTSIFNISTYVKEWLFASYLAVGAFFLSFLGQKEKIGDKSLSVLPNWYTSISILLLIFAGSFILLFSLGYQNPVRERGLVPVFFIIALLSILLFSKIGRSPLFSGLHKALGKNGVFAVVIVVFILSISNSTNLKMIHHDLNTGNAKKLSEQTEFVFNYIENSTEDTIRIPDITARSYVLYPSRIPEKPKGINHWFLSAYFNKPAIIQDKSKTLEEFMKEHKEN